MCGAPPRRRRLRFAPLTRHSAARRPRAWRPVPAHAPPAKRRSRRIRRLLCIASDYFFFFPPFFLADFLAAFFFPPFFFAAIVVLSMTGVNRPFDPPVDRRAGQPDSEEYWAPFSTRDRVARQSFNPRRNAVVAARASVCRRLMGEMVTCASPRQGAIERVVHQPPAFVTA